VRFQGLYDSGAACSVLGRKGWSRLKDQGNDPQSTNSVVSVADGRVCEFLGTVDLMVVFDGVGMKLRFLVAPSLPHDLILGIDFCNAFQVVVDVSGHTAYSKLGNQGAINLDEMVISKEELDARQADALNSPLAKYRVTLGREGLGCTALYERTYHRHG